MITAVDDEPLSDPDSLLGALERYQPGETVTLSLWRGGKTRRQAVTLAASDEQARRGGPPAERTRRPRRVRPPSLRCAAAARARRAGCAA